MKNLGYYDGKYDLIENMMVPFDDRVHYYGDGVYDATCAGNHIIFNLEEHIERFYNSAGLLEIKIPHTKDELKEILKEMVRNVDGDQLFVYWQVTRAVAPRSHAFPDEKAKLWIMIRPTQIGDPKKLLKLITVEDTRFLHCNIKTLNLIPNVMAAQKAAFAGCDEVVFHRGDRVTECAHSNVHIIKDGKFITPPADHYILPGIGRAHLIRMSKKLGIPVDETIFTVNDMMEADEVIVSSSSNFCLSACKIDGQTVGGKAPELLHKLQEALMDEYLIATKQKEE
ncbi:D-alanine transaminase [Mobilisporobacter senegalensis]|uniref:D-alanine transaminase n=1 Tax=Mobilisporobacter senegalensis TaxID=1329262 RepID=A0A3N1XHZ7_9FIRM|nr:aminotransferase class IV [Mobilisporobacter senegalensis]ROR26339.1 D-alanine transaminase [Mobilisporobacter senegalensis]